MASGWRWGCCKFGVGEIRIILQVRVGGGVEKVFERGEDNEKKVEKIDIKNKRAINFERGLQGCSLSFCFVLSVFICLLPCAILWLWLWAKQIYSDLFLRLLRFRYRFYSEYRRLLQTKLQPTVSVCAAVNFYLVLLVYQKNSTLRTYSRLFYTLLCHFYCENNLEDKDNRHRLLLFYEHLFNRCKS